MSSAIEMYWKECLWKMGTLSASPRGPGAGGEGEADAGVVQELLLEDMRVQEKRSHQSQAKRSPRLQAVSTAGLSLRPAGEK